MNEALSTGTGSGAVAQAESVPLSAGPSTGASSGQADAARQLRWARAWGGELGLGDGRSSSTDRECAAEGLAPADASGCGELTDLESVHNSGHTSARTTAQTTTHTLADWRSRHQRQLGEHGAAASADAASRSRADHRDAGAGDEAAGLAASALAWQQPTPSLAAAADPSRMDPPLHPTGAGEELRSLVESCCTRLLVAQPVAGAAHGVLLDLGRWMPGCSIEVARSEGVLRLTLRGAAGDRRTTLGDGLAQLRDDLQHSLGCPVVMAIEDPAGGSWR